jgi:GNAT superfamily N-acetyltransferase
MSPSNHPTPGIAQETILSLLFLKRDPCTKISVIRTPERFSMQTKSSIRRFEVKTSEDASLVLSEAETFLNRTPAEHNLVLTLLHERARHQEPGRYWTVLADDQVVGLALQSPPTVPAVLTEIPLDSIEKLAETMAADRPNLPGVFSEAAIAARFTGCWAEKLKIPVAPVEAVRLYRLTVLHPPPAASGSARIATNADFELILSWLDGFKRDTGAITAPPDAMRRRIEAGLIWIWEDGKPVSMASTTTPLAGTVRVGLVYTPPENRRRGYAASCVAEISRATLDAGVLQCVLFTQLSNPRSNAIYRRLGYEPVIELLRYQFR